MIYLRCQSHRARERLLSRLDDKPQAVFSVYRDFVYGVYAVDEAEWNQVKPVKGVSKIRHPERYRFTRCWS